jgi:hypothetical protein
VLLCLSSLRNIFIINIHIIQDSSKVLKIHTLFHKLILITIRHDQRHNIISVICSIVSGAVSVTMLRTWCKLEMKVKEHDSTMIHIHCYNT